MMMIVVVMIMSIMMIVIVIVMMMNLNHLSYDDLVKLLNQYTKIIRKTRAKNDKLEAKKDSLLAKYDIAEKASVELR